MNIVQTITKPFNLIADYVLSVVSELKLIEWIKVKDLANFTLVVLVYCLALTVFIYLADMLLVAVRNGLLGSTTL